MEAKAVYWLHCVSAVYWLHCVIRRSRNTSHLSSIRLTYVRETTMKYDVLRTIPLNIHTSQNENETLYKRCVFNKHVYCSSTAHDVASNTGDVDLSLQ